MLIRAIVSPKIYIKKSRFVYLQIPFFITRKWSGRQSNLEN